MDIQTHPLGLQKLIVLLVGRELAAKLVSPWVYAVATLICLIAFAYGEGFQRSFDTESVLVTTDPLMTLDIVVVVFLGLILGLRLATSMSWEREHGTLDVLLVAPVPRLAILLAKYLVEICVLVMTIALFATYLFIAQPLGRGVIGTVDLISVIQMPLFVLPVMAFGLLISVATSTVRSSVVLYLVFIGLFAVFDGGLGILNTTPADEMSLSSLYIRSGFQAIAPIVQTISPVSKMSFLIERLFNQNPITLLQILWVFLLTAVLLAIAYSVARLKGSSR